MIGCLEMGRMGLMGLIPFTHSPIHPFTNSPTHRLTHITHIKNSG